MAHGINIQEKTMITINTNPSLVFVYLGKLPDYAKYSLILNSRYNKIVLLCDTNFEYSIPNVDVISIKLFYKSNLFIDLADNSTKNFRDGFWSKTIERFYVLMAYMKYYNIKSLFHGEIDNLIFSLEKMPYYLNKLGSGLFYPKLNDKIAAASLMYINSIKELELMCTYFNEQKSFKDDMQMLAEYFEYSQNVFQLPSENNLSDDLPMYVENEKCIFDVASFGQYLFGIDLRNSLRPIFNKYQNVHCRTDLSKIKFRINEISNEFYLQNNGQEFKVINLHIHSKIFKKICCDNKFVLKIVNKLNNGTSTLISINVRNYKFIRNIFSYINSF